MIRAKIFFIFLAIFSGCKFVPYSGNDIYNGKAELPLDEAPHFKNSLEWWYFTGHLQDKNSDKEFGVEYVFFHFNPRNRNDYYMVNIAISDPQDNKFYYDYKIKKLEELLAPELPLDLKLQVKDQLWSLSGQQGEYELDARMLKHEAGLSLTTRPLKPILLHNETGYEKYGPYATAGYLSYPRLNATGNLVVDNKNYVVEGELWYDRQWNCIGVYTKDVAWDWFSIQFEEKDEELMIYQLYNVEKDDYVYGGSLFTEDGTYKDLPDDVQLIPLGYWVSPDSKVRYPVKWQIIIPTWEMDLIVSAMFDEQELKIKFGPLTSLYYWEGMCSVEGTREGASVTGNSYIEMTNRGIMK